jgi:ribosomal protein S18 acetylase RimI-like enzyme
VSAVPVTVRTLVDDDLDGALALWAGTEHLGPVALDDVHRVRRGTPELVLVAEDGGGIVGVVLGSDDARRGWINRLAVATHARRRGVARALIAELEARLRARGCVQVNLLVYAHNQPGRAMWDGLGYTSSDDLVMYRRRLDEGADGAC